MSEEQIFSTAPGEKYEDDRSRLAIFFGVLGRKFWRLMGVNLMYLLFNIPAIIIGLFLSIYMMELYLPSLVQDSQNDLLTMLFVSTFPLVMFLMAVPVLSVGPAQSGLTYLLRCYAYEQPTFTWSDFKDKMKENWKQGLLVSVINLAVLLFMIIDIYLYPRLGNTGGFIMPIFNALLIMVFILFLMMNMYIYPMMVTYQLKIKHLYKNAFLFAFARLIPNLLILILCAILIIGPILIVSFTASVLALTISYVFYIIFGFTLPGLIINSFVNPTIDKYLKKDELSESK